MSKYIKTSDFKYQASLINTKPSSNLSSLYEKEAEEVVGSLFLAKHNEIKIFEYSENNEPSENIYYTKTISFFKNIDNYSNLRIRLNEIDYKIQSASFVSEIYTKLELVK